MSSKTLLILTVIVALLGGFIYFVERDLPSTDERAEQAKKVLDVDQDEVRAIEIAWQGADGEETVVRLERQDGASEEDDEEAADADEEAAENAVPRAPEWRLVEPLTARADANAVDALLATLTGLEKDRTLERSEVEFDAPRGRVTLVGDAGETTLEIGDEVPGTSGMLVALAGATKVHQVSRTAWDELIRAPGEWRDPSLFPYSRPDIDRLTLRSPAGQVVLARRDEPGRGAEFWIESPLQDLADEERVNGLLSEITGLTAESFVDHPPPLEELGLAAPDRVVEAVIAGREVPFRLTLGNPVGEGNAPPDGGELRYARVDGQVVEIDSRLASALERPAEKWRSRAWTPLQVFEIDAARFRDEMGEIELVRDEGQWRRDGERIDYSTASDALYAIADVDAAEVVSVAEAKNRGHALAEPTLEIVLESGGIDATAGVVSQTLRLYPAVGEWAAATRDGREAVLLVAAQSLENLRAAVEQARSAEVLADEDEGASEEE